VQPWFEVGGSIIQELVIRQDMLGAQVEAIGAQIMFWGRMAAQAKRVWEIEERHYRVWRDRTMLALLEEQGDGKKRTKEQLEQLLRQHPEYAAYYRLVERAEEAANAADAVLDGFRAQKEMFRAAVTRSREDAAPRLSV
jgi:lipopolysaccharide biosynthesis regulator YciM